MMVAVMMGEQVCGWRCRYGASVGWSSRVSRACGSLSGYASELFLPEVKAFWSSDLTWADGEYFHTFIMGVRSLLLCARVYGGSDDSGGGGGGGNGGAKCAGESNRGPYAPLEVE